MSDFINRHVGPNLEEEALMAKVCGFNTVDDLMDATVPASIRLSAPLEMPEALSEHEALTVLREKMSQNRVLRSFLGMGYHDTITPPVILRNVLENPGWYTAYTPYQAEISQGRMEALMNFQTMITNLTALDVANASLLDEGTAVAEAISLCAGFHRAPKKVWLDEECHAHVLDVVRTRCAPLGWEILTGSLSSLDPASLEGLFAVVVAYPGTHGAVIPDTAWVEQVHAAGARVIADADLLFLTLAVPPGEWGADVCVGNTQRFGVPLGFGGPHAAYMAVKDDLKRKMPGRLIGVSIDSKGRPSYRLSLQTREQHIRRDKATSNICTAQVLLAVMASMYAVYHGPEGLKQIAQRIHRFAQLLASKLTQGGFVLRNPAFFDTLTVELADVAAAKNVVSRALEYGINLRLSGSSVVVALDEKITIPEIARILEAFGVASSALETEWNALEGEFSWSSSLHRRSEFLQAKVFHRYHSETEMMRYLRRLEHKDIALNRSMIPLGSCTMKLNAAAEMIPVTWPEVGGIHPYAPSEQSQGYRQLFEELESWLAKITGFHAVSLQPNAGSQGELAGLLAIRDYHLSNGDTERTICLIPTSAHGTNPASAVMAGMKVSPVKCDEWGNVDLEDLKVQITKVGSRLAALMITYPSTHGVFEEGIVEICRLIHEAGGQVYMDGANMNAQVAFTSPGFIGADVCHLNLHKTFCIPHGGGGPGVGPIGVAKHLAPFLPGHELLDRKVGSVSSAPWGSAGILVIPWMYLAMTGAEGLKRATRVAVLNANYIANKLSDRIPVLYRGKNGTVAHECILDFRGFHKIAVEDVAKRLIDYGFHAPTMSWPVGGTLMVEPTESESLEELDRFIDAMVKIYEEIQAVESGAIDAELNPLKLAPHPAEDLLATDWNLPYTREQAAYPAPWVKKDKYWPPVSRVDNVYGDRNLVCTCEGMDAYSDEE